MAVDQSHDYSQKVLLEPNLDHAQESIPKTYRYHSRRGQTCPDSSIGSHEPKGQSQLLKFKEKPK